MKTQCNWKSTKTYKSKLKNKQKLTKIDEFGIIFYWCNLIIVVFYSDSVH